MGKDKIFLIRDGELQEMRKRKYDEEQKLQKQIEDHTSLIPGEQINPDNPRKWLMVERESKVPSEEDGGDRWSMDHLFIDQDGVPTLIEVKRQQDTRIRRKVVAQMLDYAANTTRYWKVDTIKERFKAKVENPEEELERVLDDETDISKFWENVENNLERGKIRMLFVADDIPSELKSIVEFLNEQMTPAEVLAVELGHYEGQGEEALVPRVVGQTEAARRKKNPASQRGPPRTPWNEENFFKELESNLDKESVRAMKKLYNKSKDYFSEVTFGSRSKKGSVVFYPEFDKDGTVFTLYGDGSMRVYFQFNKEINQKLKKIFSNVSGIDITPEDERNRIWLNISDVKINLVEFIKALEKVREIG